MEKFQKNMYVVLVEPKNPGNIGSSVRAMKNMGIANLRLVNPVDYRDHEEQRKLGYRSQEIIENSQVFATLSEALADISTVFLATARKGKWKKNFVSPEQCGELVAERILKEKVALVFGREDSGVTIDESQLANFHIHIPSAVSYPSLNLSQAVMVLSYEVYKKALMTPQKNPYPKVAPKKSYERLMNNIWGLMKRLEFREDDYGLFHRSLRRALTRTHWTNADIAVFDRACKQVRWFCEKHLGMTFEVDE